MELAEMLNAAETTADPMQLLGVMQQGLEQQRQLMDTIKGTAEDVAADATADAAADATAARATSVLDTVAAWCTPERWE